MKKQKYVFNKWVFRSVIFAMIILFFITWLVEGQKLTDNVYISCPENAVRCDNPLYGECEDFPEYCDIEYFNSGDEFGEKPGLLYKSFFGLSIFFIMIGFFVNHIFFNKGVVFEW